MGWETVLVERLRYYINDLDAADYDWTDAQLQKFLAIATIDVINATSRWSSTVGSYTVDTSATGAAMISPDPLSSSVAAFSNLIVLRAACIIAKSEFKRASKETGAGWKITDDRSTIDGTKAIDASKQIAGDYCGSYEEALADFKSGNRYAGYAILTPFTSPRTFPRGAGNPGCHGGYRDPSC